MQNVYALVQTRLHETVKKSFVKTRNETAIQILKTEFKYRIDKFCNINKVLSGPNYQYIIYTFWYIN